jgi:hypothetical protein
MAPVLFDSIPLGYAQVAALMSKEQDYAVFRKFTALNARNLLYLQAEITHLEQRLHEIDEALKASDDGKAVLSSWLKYVEDRDRMTLIRDIRQLLTEYSRAHISCKTNYTIGAESSLDATLVAYNQVLNMNRPAALQLEGLKVWCQDSCAISDISKDYLESREIRGDLKQIIFDKKQKKKKQKNNKDLEAGYDDLVSMTESETSWLSRFLRTKLVTWIFTVGLEDQDE